MARQDQIPSTPIPVWSDEQFFREYFIQTRKEIDVEKHERDQLLNFCIVFLGAVLYGLLRDDKAGDILSELITLTLGFPALAVILALFWVRHMKLQQIADRWFTLARILPERFGPRPGGELLENVVCRDLLGRRYGKKDVLLNLAFSLPFYAMLMVHAQKALLIGKCFRGFSVIAGVILHFIGSGYVLLQPMKNPFESKPEH